MRQSDHETGRQGRPIFFAATLERIRAERRARIIALWLDIALLIVLAALCGWLLTLVKSASLPPPVVVGMAMVPWGPWVVMGVLFAAMSVTIFCAVRKIREEDERRFGEAVWPDESEVRGSRFSVCGSPLTEETGRLQRVKEAERVLFAARVQAAAVSRSVRATLKMSEDSKAEIFWQQEWMRRGLERLEEAERELRGAVEGYRLVVWNLDSEIRMTNEEGRAV